MSELGWIAHRKSWYGIGARLVERALAGGNLPLRVAVLPVLEDLRATARGTVHFAVLDDDEVLILEEPAGQSGWARPAAQTSVCPHWGAPSARSS